MSTALAPYAAGQRMSRAEFHARYKDAPPGPKFELIDGVVHMASPPGMTHGHRHGRIMAWLGVYAMHTPGTEEFDNASTALSEASEVQPDASLRIIPALGGRSRDQGGIIGGAV